MAVPKWIETVVNPSPNKKKKKTFENNREEFNLA
jgi:hypothetical protein